ncbi:echinoderm microtubule-associated protein-like 1 isoform X1 [Xyrichtys novacula]|uniref:Echinoderm microtubule-associated protein-like 1 isoform X1 n=1 Tax=Xyrichtys novacula TaxID=13765 RepID=A0AAV1GVZ2_XYRNO|nr:echinoderm microtubule-associated protein-like 1 isoform X1 [Xyrichtys novacula]
MQMQEDEIQLLKLALADVLKRLNISEEHQAAAAAAASAGGRRTTGAKARPVSLALPSRAPMVTSSSAKKSSTLPSSSTARNYSPTPALSSVKSPPGSVKDSPCKTSRSRPSSAASTSRKTQEGSSKSKEAAVPVGSRRVTHCKVTMQIYLSPLTRKTGSSESAKSAASVSASSGSTATPNNPQTKGGDKPEARKTTPSFTLNLQKTTTSQNTTQDSSNYNSPLKSPSQYFQICY